MSSAVYSSVRQIFLRCIEITILYPGLDEVFNLWIQLITVSNFAVNRAENGHWNTI